MRRTTESPPTTHRRRSQLVNDVTRGNDIPQQSRSAPKLEEASFGRNPRFNFPQLLRSCLRWRNTQRARSLHPYATQRNYGLQTRSFASTIAMARARDNSKDQNLSSAQRIVNVFHRQQMKSIEAFLWMFIWKVSQKSGCQNFHLHAAWVNNFGKLKPDAIMGALFASALHGWVQA